MKQIFDIESLSNRSRFLFNTDLSKYDNFQYLLRHAVSDFYDALNKSISIAEITSELKRCLLIHK